jgi:hypothetical protein
VFFENFLLLSEAFSLGLSACGMEEILALSLLFIQKCVQCLLLYLILYCNFPGHVVASVLPVGRVSS